MKTIIIIGLVFGTAICSGQTIKLTDEQINQSGVNRLIFTDDIEKAKELSRQDIANGTPFILLFSGIAPITYLNDTTFERKYESFYYEFGCNGPMDDKYLKAYNEVTFEYLKNNYGTKWTKEIRKDVIGFKDWKKRKK